MKPFIGLLLSLAVAGLSSAVARADQVLFDNASKLGTFGAFSTSSTPNTFMGTAVNLDLSSGANRITGFDLYPVNTTGSNFVALQMTIYVWDTVNTSGTVNSATPAFSNLLATRTVTSSGAFNSGFYFPFEGTPGTPGVALAAPIVLTDNQIGVSFNFKGSTDGTTFNDASNLTSIIAAGPTAADDPVTVGSDVFNGYYRNANSETNGNFTSSLRSLGGIFNQSLALRVYGDSTTAPAAVPLPSTFLAGGALLALLGLCRWQKNRHAA